MAKNIMVVDDQAFIRQVIGTELKKLGYEVSFAVDGLDCLTKIKSSTEKIDLIIMDVMMPNLDGYEACRRVRQELNETMPIIFLSANSLKTSIIKAVQSGGNDYVVKDPDPTKLLQKIQQHLGSPS
ncbi:MAG: response regulator [Candidatus Aureabacteria bacterium]|nr:response regulator [Candidatus Auribacterota bacterium]